MVKEICLAMVFKIESFSSMEREGSNKNENGDLGLVQLADIWANPYDYDLFPMFLLQVKMNILILDLIKCLK